MRSYLSVSLLGALSDEIRTFITGALHEMGATVGSDTADAVIVTVGLDAPAGPLVELTSDGWSDAVDRPLNELLAAMQAARLQLLGRGGAIVVIVPTIGVPGAKHLVPLTTVVEGARSMAKSAARQWATDGIAVNMLALPLPLLVPDLERHTTHIPLASGPVPSPADVAPMLEAFLRSTTAITGATVIADGGSVMVP